MKRYLFKRLSVSLAALSGFLVISNCSVMAQERVLGVDISYWNCGTSANGISQANWDIGYSTGNRKFAYIRATRGGTTGVDRGQGTPSPHDGASTLSRRYDDPRFIQNITRAAASGMLSGAYHFARPDVSGNTGADEADHFMEMAGPWMRPGYMIPVFDQEAGSGSDYLVQFALDFSNRMFEVLQIRPGMYINGAYSSVFQGATQARRDALAKPVVNSPSVVGPAYSMLWDARYGAGSTSQSDPNYDINDIPVQTGSPQNNGTVNNTYYGPWDDYGNTQPWAFWQFSSVASVPGFNNVDTGIDSNVSHGDIEYVRNFLVPAVWWHNGSGDWSTLTNWNSGQPIVPPDTPDDQADPYVTGPLPEPRLPGAAGTGSTSGQYDTVILERPNANITVTVSTGTHNVRKLYMREALNITGGSLTVNYDPTYRPDDSSTVLHGGPVSAQFSGPVTLSGGTLKVHTLRVDPAKTLSLAGGSLFFDKIQLMPSTSTTPGKLLMTGNATFAPFATDPIATITNGPGSGTAGSIDLIGAARTFTITGPRNLLIEVSILNGAVVKAGSGIMHLNKASSYAGGTTVSAGTLLVNNTSSSGTGSGAVTVSGGVLGGTGRISGTVTVNAGATIAPGAANAIGNLTLTVPPALGGTVSMQIDRNGGSSLADKITVSGGTLVYGGNLVVANTGSPLVGGEVFTLFSASAYAGSFASTQLPILDPGLNWYLGDLAVNGTIRVNRSPIPSLLTFTNNPVQGLQIPIASLLAASTDPDGNAIAVAGVGPASTNGVPLATNGAHIVYSSSANGQDQFSYTVTDGRGGIATGLVRIVPSSQGQFRGLPTVNVGSVALELAGGPGGTYYIDRSTNLPVWVTISTNVVPSNGVFNFTDQFEGLDGQPGAAFYRIRW